VKHLKNLLQKFARLQKNDGAVVLEVLLIVIIAFVTTFFAQKLDYYKRGLELEASKDFGNAIISFASSNNKKSAQKLPELIKSTRKHRIAAGNNHTVGLNADGTVVAVGDNSNGQCNVSEWQDIISVAAGSDFTAALTLTGTVLSTNDDWKMLADWHDVIELEAGGDFIAALRSDGKVLLSGKDGYVPEEFKYALRWNDVVMLAVSSNSVSGLRKDGRVLTLGAYSDITQDWRYVQAIYASPHTITCIKQNGVVQSTNMSASKMPWDAVFRVAAGSSHTLGITSKGKVFADGSLNYGERNITDWQDIIDIAAGPAFSVGLKADGTLLAVGNNSSGQCNISDWKLI
jgi:alpha-tubulin suppressor-like RCC1 family protein